MGVEAISRFSGMFEETAQELERIHELQAKTDADFVIDGQFNQRAKDEHVKALSRDRVYEQAMNRGLAALAVDETLGLDDYERVAAHSTLYSGLYRFERQVQVYPEDIEDVFEATEENIKKMDTVLEWWRNPAPYFSVLSKEGVSVFRARAGDNVELAGEYDRSGHNRPRVGAVFSDGVKVEASLDGKLAKITHEPVETHEIGLLGWTGKNHASLDSFQGPSYEDYFS